jgi:tight adherence protein C
MLLLAVISTFVAISALVYTIVHKPEPLAQQRLEAFLGLRDQARPGATSSRWDNRPSRGQSIKAMARQFLPNSMLDRLGRMLIAAGMRSAPETVALIWAGVALGLPLFYLFIASQGKSGIGQTQLLVMLLAGGFGAYLPFVLINGRVRRRRAALLKAMPDAMDLLTTCVEAGLGIDAALGRVAEKAKEPLAEEVRLVLRTMAMGRTRREALEQLASRNGLTELTSFVSAVIQAESMGVSLGHVLRVQTEALRVARKQRAEQTAMKAPVKIIVVLALFIFPAMFVVIIGPAVLQFMNSSATGGP